MDTQSDRYCGALSPLQDVFILDTCTSCFVWVGSAASPSEKKNGFGYAHVRPLSIANDRNCADTIGTVSVPWAGHFRCVRKSLTVYHLTDT